MLEHCIHTAALIHLELAGGVVVEAVEETKAGFNRLLLPVKGELSADCLVGVGGVAHIQNESAELDNFLVSGFVLQTNKSIGGWAP